MTSKTNDQSAPERAGLPCANMVAWQVRVCGLLALAVGLSGCFFYDSRWSQQKQAEKHALARSTPHELRARSELAETRVADRKLRLRVYASLGYATSVLDWQKQFSQVLDCANSVFVPDFGAAFEAVEFKTFRPKSSEEKLDGVLQELTQEDPGTDVDWVIGLAIAVPRFAPSADDLGLAPLLGDHLAMRAMSDPHEYEAIQKAFPQLSEDEGFKLYQRRKKHKLCTVFLHEVAHTLGVPHERLAASLMNQRYQVEAQGFSSQAAEIVRASLRVRAARPKVFLDAALAREMGAQLTATGADWEPQSRDALMRQLAPFASAAPPAQTPVAEASARPQGDAIAVQSAPAVVGLSAEEQRSYERARAELRAGRAASAREIARPSLAKHPDLPALVSLRCDIAMALGGDWETISAECPGLSPFGASK